jgi:WD40 repeat protein
LVAAPTTTPVTAPATVLATSVEEVVTAPVETVPPAAAADPERATTRRRPQRIRSAETGSLALAMAFHPDESALAVACDDDRVHLIPLRQRDTDSVLAPAPRQSSMYPLRPFSVYFDPDGARVHVIRQLPTTPRRFIGTTAADVAWSLSDSGYLGETASVRAVVHDPATGGLPLVVTGDLACRVERGVRYEFGGTPPLEHVRHAALSPQHVAVVTGTGRILIWRTDTGRFVRFIDGGGGPVAFTVGGHQIVATRNGTQLEFHDIEKGGISLTVPVNGPNSWAYHRSGLLFSRNTGMGRLARLGEEARPLAIPWLYRSDQASSPVFSPSGRYLAFPSSATSVEIWDLAPTGA